MSCRQQTIKLVRTVLHHLCRVRHPCLWRPFHPSRGPRSKLRLAEARAVRLGALHMHACTHVRWQARTGTCMHAQQPTHPATTGRWTCCCSDGCGRQLPGSTAAAAATLPPSCLTLLAATGLASKPRPDVTAATGAHTAAAATSGGAGCMLPLLPLGCLLQDASCGKALTGCSAAGMLCSGGGCSRRRTCAATAVHAASCCALYASAA